MSSSKGQIFSVDIIVAIGIFILIMVSCIWIWDYSRERVYLTNEREALEIYARTALSSLVETTGSPSNWHLDQDSFDTTNIDYLGLASSRSWLLLDDKIQALQDWYSSEKETYKTLLGLNGYEFHMEFWKYDGGFPPSPDYEVGIGPSATYNVVRLERTALLKEGGSRYWLKLVFEVWRLE